MPDDESFFTITGSDDGGYGRVDPSTEAINPETDVVTLYTDLLTESFVGKWQDPWTGQSFDLFHELCSEGGGCGLNSDLYIMRIPEQLVLDAIAQATWKAQAAAPGASLRLLSSMELRIFAAAVVGDLSSDIDNLVAGGLDRRQATAQAISKELKAASSVQGEEGLFGNPYLPAVGVEIESRLGRRDSLSGEYVPLDTLRQGYQSAFDLADRPRRYIDAAYLPMFTFHRELIIGPSEGDVGEIVPRPYITPEALLGDIEQLCRAGLVPERKSHSVHITIGDLSIGSNDLRPMLISMMVWAEGYAGAYKNKGSVVHERYMKYDFPFHRSRTVFNGNNGVGPVRPHTACPAVEFRSLWKVHSVKDLEHVVDGLYYLSVPLAAAQRAEKDTISEALANIWEQTENAFVSLLSTYNIDTAGLVQLMEKINVSGAEDKSEDGTETTDSDLLIEVYGRILGSIRTLQRTVPEFRTEARKLVSESKRAVTEVLNASETVSSII